MQLLFPRSCFDLSACDWRLDDEGRRTEKICGEGNGPPPPTQTTPTGAAALPPAAAALAPRSHGCGRVKSLSLAATCTTAEIARAARQEQRRAIRR